jgi:hypothetical protein
VQVVRAGLRREEVVSMEYWPILGYGVQLTPDMINPHKAARFMGTDDYAFHELLQKLCGLAEGAPLAWASTGEMWDEEYYYLYCPAVVPWGALKEPWRNATPEAVREAILKALGRVLRDDIDVSTLAVDEISDVGCG